MDYGLYKLDVTPMAKEKSIFDEFTNLYEFSKTLQFGLTSLKWDENKKTIVDDRDWSVLKSHGIIEKDKRIAENIKSAKFYLDILHRELIDKALNNLKFENNDLEKYAQILEKLEINKKSKSKTDAEKEQKKDIAKELRKQLSQARDSLLETVGKTFINESKKLATGDRNALLLGQSLDILKKRFTTDEVGKLRRENKEVGVEYLDVVYKDEDKIPKSVFDMDAGYLDEFHKNRELVYSAKGKKGSLGKRILDNFDIFLRNKKVFEEKYKNSTIDFAEVERNFGITGTGNFFDRTYAIHTTPRETMRY